MAKNRKGNATKHSARESERHIAQLEAAQTEQDNSRQALLALVDELQESRRKIEHARREWTDAFDALRDPIFLHDKDLHIIRANRAYAVRAGLDIKDIIGKPFWQIFPKNTGPPPSCQRAPENKDEEEEEEVAIPETGEAYLSRSFAVRDGQGAYQHSVHILEDITERKRAEAALRKSEERYRSLAENLNELIYRADPKTLAATYVNRAVERIYGYTVEEWLKNPELWKRTIHSDDRERVLRVVAEAKAKAESGAVEYRILRRDGTIRWVIDRFSWEKNPAGQIVSLSGVMSDITERRQAEEILRRTDRALRTLSTCNQTLVRATDEQALLRDMCRAIVEVNGYPLAWIGWVEHDAAKSVRPVARAGYEEGFLETLRLTWADTERGRGPTGTAIRTGEPQTVRHIQTDPRYTPWRAQALKRGYASVAALPLKEEDGEVFAVLNVYAAEPDAFDESEVRLLQELAGDIAFGVRTLRLRAEHDRLQEEHFKTAERLKEALTDTIRAIAHTVEKRDPYTAGHQQRVAQLCMAIASELGMAPGRIEGLRLGALIHDIGKIYIPAEILSRPGKLTPAEFEMIKTHPQVGYDIIKDVTFPWPVADMILQHHERLDGSGYPQGLKGGEILLESRILAVADTVEALSSHRPYRPGLGIEAGLNEITQRRGTHYDPAVVDACLRLFKEKGFKL